MDEYGREEEYCNGDEKMSSMKAPCNYSNKTLAYCQKCGKDCKATIHKWSTIVCDECSNVISSNIGIDKGGL